MPKHENHRSRFSDSKPVKKMFKNGLTFEKMMFLCLKCFLVPMYRLPRWTEMPTEPSSAFMIKKILNIM